MRDLQFFNVKLKFYVGNESFPILQFKYEFSQRTWPFCQQCGNTKGEANIRFKGKLFPLVSLHDQHNHTCVTSNKSRYMSGIAAVKVPLTFATFPPHRYYLSGRICQQGTQQSVPDSAVNRLLY